MDKTIDHRIAWLAGIIDGEGWIRLHLQTLKRSASTCLRSEVAVGNTDTAMIAEVMSILDVLGVRFSQYIRAPRGTVWGFSRKAQTTVEVRRREDVLVLLQKLIPFLITKRARAEIVVRAIQHRAPMGHYSKPGHTPLDLDVNLKAMIEEVTFLNGKKENPSE